MKESEIPIHSREAVKEHELESSIFDHFGTNLDKTSAERASEINEERRTIIIRQKDRAS